MNILTNKDILISLDIALNTTGLVVMTPNKDVLYTSLIEAKRHWDYYRKLDYLYDLYCEEFDNILTQEPKSAILVLEGRLKGGFSGQTLASIEGARVNAYRAFHHIAGQHEKDVNMVIYDPNDVKYEFSGKRNANKEYMRKSVSSQFSWLEDIDYQEDIYDAIYLNLYHLRQR